MFERLSELVDEYAGLERDLADAAVVSDPERAKALGRRYGELTPVVHAYTQLRQTSEDEATARELATEDQSFAAEAEELGCGEEGCCVEGAFGYGAGDSVEYASRVDRRPGLGGGWQAEVCDVGVRSERHVRWDGDGRDGTFG